jgi:tetratricopeptide (TPR) repeat protein
LPNNPKTGQLIWQDKARHISKPLADFIDELMAILPSKRPHDTSVILRYLTPKGLLLKSIQRIVNSPKFKLITLGFMTCVIIYRASFPLISQYYYEQGVKYLESEELDRALPYYEKALNFNKNDARIYNDMGLICQKKKDIDCAKNNYDRALKLNPNNSVARYNLAGFYDDAGDFKQAEIQYYHTIESKSPVAVNAISDLARLQILQGNTTAAIKLSLEGLQQTDQPKVKSALYKNLGWAHWMENNYQEAEVDLRQAIKLNSERTDAYCLLAQVLESQNDRKEGL